MQRHRWAVLVVPLEQVRADQKGDRFLVGNIVNDLGGPLDLPVETLIGLVLCGLRRCMSID